MLFSQDDVNLYRCTRGGDAKWSFPTIGNGKYMINLMVSDDKVCCYGRICVLLF
jgi:hypothetical protein